MTGAVIIYGSSKEKRIEKSLEIVSELYGTEYKSFKMLQRLADANVIQAEEGKKSIGIRVTKAGSKWLTEKPFSKKYKVLIFANADLLTVQAQNSLLKTLEEPPNYALIILLSKSESSLLETVISRCKKVNIITSGMDVSSEYSGEFDIVEIMGMDIGKRLVVANEISKLDGEDIIDLVEYWLLALRDIKTTDAEQNIKNYRWISNLTSFKNDLESTNVNVKFGMENLFINS